MNGLGVAGHSSPGPRDPAHPPLNVGPDSPPPFADRFQGPEKQVKGPGDMVAAAQRMAEVAFAVFCPRKLGAGVKLGGSEPSRPGSRHLSAPQPGLPVRLAKGVSSEEWAVAAELI